MPGVAADILDRVARVVDSESTRETPPEQLVHGLFDCAGEYRLRGGRRIAKGQALREHMEEAVALKDEELISLQRLN